MGYQDQVNGNVQILHNSLLRALESARTRLAIAIAAESKMTPVGRWQYYLETAEQIRLQVKDLRAAGCDRPTGQRRWHGALEELQNLHLSPCEGHSEAQLLCRKLRAVLAMLE